MTVATGLVPRMPEGVEPDERVWHSSEFLAKYDETGRDQAGRDYRLVTSPELPCGIYLQGGTEHTHGLASSLLSHIAVRSGEIADSIIQRRAGRSDNAARFS